MCYRCSPSIFSKDIGIDNRIPMNTSQATTHLCHTGDHCSLGKKNIGCILIKFVKSSFDENTYPLYFNLRKEISSLFSFRTEGNKYQKRSLEQYNLTNYRTASQRLFFIGHSTITRGRSICDVP